MKITGRQRTKQKTRKELRKDKRQQKKINRFHYHCEKKNSDIKTQNKDDKTTKKKKIHDDGEIEDSEDEEIPSSDEEETIPKSKKSKTDNSSDTQLQKFLKREKEQQDEYFNEIKLNRVDQLKQANDEEDKIISKYEKLLKLNKRRKKEVDDTFSKFNDGLDYLLQLCTDDNIQKMYMAAKEADEVSDVEEVPSKEKRKVKKKVAWKESGDMDDSLNEEDEYKVNKKAEKLKSIEKKYFGDDEDYFNNLEIDSVDGSDSELDDEVGDEIDEEEQSEPSDLEDEEEEQSEPSDLEDEEEEQSDLEDEEEEQSDFKEEDNQEEKIDLDEENSSSIKEDIYGRKRDKAGNVIHEDTTKYVPPHMRKSLKSVDVESDPQRREKLQNLKRQIKGFINRLAEANLHRISIDIENIYNANARNDANTVLSEVILDSLVLKSLSNERLILEHTLLISILHANLGSEIGAYFLQILIEKFENMYKMIDAIDVENKELDNVVFIICHLYTYRLFKHNIIYELLDKLCEKLTEKRIECVLLVLKSIGFILRKDDPLALKGFILKAQKLLNTNEGDKNTRMSYMLDILMAIKNNNVTKIPQYDASLVEHFRKLLKQFVRAGNYVTTLAISVEDLLKAEERGKWWLVGSAWAGNNADKSKSHVINNTVDDEQRNKIFALAKKQRMNTDAKRNIFYVLMTAEDYIDAFEKILSSTSDERTIISVILHCCLSEKEYNAYYSVLSQKFCQNNRKFLLAIQFAVWDKIKEIQNLTAKQLNNLSRLLIFLIENDNLPLSVLKVVEFTQIEKITLKFVRQIMLGLLLTTNEENFSRIFERISPSFKLNSFKDQLRLFLKIFLLKDESKLNISEEQMKLLKARILLADKLLSVKHF